MSSTASAIRPLLQMIQIEKSFPGVRALRGVDLSLGRGEVLALLGENGAGKSTLLKLIAGITKPTSGRVRVDGRISALIELGAGFHPEISGRENVYLNGSVLGLTRRQIRSKFDEIVDFSGISKFIDTPIKPAASNTIALGSGMTLLATIQAPRS